MPSLTCKKCSSLVIYSDTTTRAICPKCGLENVVAPPASPPLPVAPVLDPHAARSAPAAPPAAAHPPHAPHPPGHDVRKAPAAPAGAAPAGAVVAPVVAPVVGPRPSAPPEQPSHLPTTRRPASLQRRRGAGAMALPLVLGLVVGGAAGFFGATLLGKATPLPAPPLQNDPEFVRLHGEIKTLKLDAEQLKAERGDLQGKLAKADDAAKALGADKEALVKQVQDLARERAKLETWINDLLYQGAQPSDGRPLRPGQPLPVPPTSRPAGT